MHELKFEMDAEMVRHPFLFTIFAAWGCQVDFYYGGVCYGHSFRAGGCARGRIDS